MFCSGHRHSLFALITVSACVCVCLPADGVHPGIAAGHRVKAAACSAGPREGCP